MRSCVQGLHIVTWPILKCPNIHFIIGIRMFTNAQLQGGEGRGGRGSGDMSLPCTQAVVLRSHVVRNV